MGEKEKVLLATSGDNITMECFLHRHAAFMNASSFMEQVSLLFAYVESLKTERINVGK